MIKGISLEQMQNLQLPTSDVIELVVFGLLFVLMVNSWGRIVKKGERE